MIETSNKSIDNMPKENKDGQYQPTQRTSKAYPGRAIPDIRRMQCTRDPGKACIAAPWGKALGIISITEKGTGSTSRGFCSSSREQKEADGLGTTEPVPERSIPTGRDQGCLSSSGARAGLIKKKSELGLKGRLHGHYKKEVREAMVKAIDEAVEQGMTQKQACNTVGLSPRKYRRWAAPKSHSPRIAWNRTLPEEKEAIIQAAYGKELLGKPISHIFVHGHDSRRYYVSLSTVYKVLAEGNDVRPKIVRKGHQRHVDAHQLLEEGFYLLCYDGTYFVTDANIGVWAIPVLLLPFRYLLHIGHSLHSVSSQDLINTVEYASTLIPESIASNLLGYSDRGSAMKAQRTKTYFIKNLNLPVYFGRPHTPEDQPWIEASIKTLKYHRDAPSHFPQVADLVDWFQRFRPIYNNEPHSSLDNVTPAQALAGLKEVILNQRKQNLYEARQARLAAYYASKIGLPEVVGVSK